MIEQGIDGTVLLEIEANDLIPMGLNNFKDRKALYAHFQALGKQTEGADTSHIK